MMKIMKKLLLGALAFASTSIAYSQTLIINEVSNGVSGTGMGTREYVEYVVVDATVTYDCMGTPIAPCVDIRGWIIDDNSGYHGTGGIAGGALRFSMDAFWQCVPVGTIIVVYNDADVDVSLIPSSDLLLSDGDCRVIIPVSNSTLIEQNGTTPGAAACSYPAVGWFGPAVWSPHGMNNTNDCARLVDLAGCEVFSVCYGALANQNNLIYFNSTGGGTTFYFSGTDPYNQADWSSGSAGTVSTPGAPNNANNAAYIAQFNNGCMPITPITASAIETNGPCPCAGEATASGSGNIPPYSFEWFDGTMTPIGQTSATATGLCDGTYFVEVTSISTGCSEMASVTIANAAGTPADVSPLADVCSNGGTVTAVANIGTGTWSASCGACINSSTGEFDPTQAAPGVNTITYTVTGTCASSDSEPINVIAAPDPGTNGNANLCTTDAPVDLATILGGSPDAGGTWSPALTSGTGVFDPAVDAPGVYTYTVNGVSPCPNATAQVTVTVVNCCNIVVTETLTDEVCAGDCGGVIDVAISGATGPFSVVLFNAGTPVDTILNVASDTSFSNLCPGAYSVEVSEGSLGQDTIWTEDFEAVTGWTLNVPTGVNGADNNFWERDDDEGGRQPNQCGVANNNDETLHITSVFNPNGGAAYDAGGLCGILFCPETNMRAESPPISTIGYTNLTVGFNFIGNGDGLTDNASLWYNDGLGWTQLDPSLKSTTCPGGQGRWTAYSIALPANCENIANLQIGFNWTNNDDGVGSDPSFAANDIYIVSASTSSCSTIENYTINASTLTAPSAGTNGSVDLCSNDSPVNLFSSLGGTPATGGNWTPALTSGTGVFAPASDAAGTYTYTVSNICGSSSATVDVTVTTVDAQFSGTPTQGAAPLEVTFTNTSTGATSYAWTFGDGNTSTAQSPINTYTAVGTYTVTLIASDGTCTDQATATVVVEGELIIPNAFSPDGDTYSQYWFITGLSAYPNNSVKIYNRWGDKVFEAAPYNNDWDGECNNDALQFFGQQVVDGTYFYFLDLGNGETFNGYVVKKTN
jgi:gliding motility-associated-like protein